MDEVDDRTQIHVTEADGKKYAVFMSMKQE